MESSPQLPRSLQLLLNVRLVLRRQRIKVIICHLYWFIICVKINSTRRPRISILHIRSQQLIFASVLVFSWLIVFCSYCSSLPMAFGQCFIISWPSCSRNLWPHESSCSSVPFGRTLAGFTLESAYKCVQVPNVVRPLPGFHSHTPYYLPTVPHTTTSEQFL